MVVAWETKTTLNLCKNAKIPAMTGVSGAASWVLNRISPCLLV